MLALRGGPLGRGQEALPPLAFEPYDEKWNLRLDGSTGGMTCFFSATDHTEVHEPTEAAEHLLSVLSLGNRALDDAEADDE